MSGRADNARQACFGFCWSSKIKSASDDSHAGPRGSVRDATSVAGSLASHESDMLLHQALPRVSANTRMAFTFARTARVQETHLRPRDDNPRCGAKPHVTRAPDATPRARAARRAPERAAQVRV